MTPAGFVLTGGRSTRMGRDKSQLPVGGGVLADHIVHVLQQIASPVQLVGGAAGLPDLYPGFGPVGGILTALRASESGWNLVVACDMPCVTKEVLQALLEAALRNEANCIVPRTPDGRQHPLCAAYHQRAEPDFTAAVNQGIHTLRSAIRLTAHEFLDYSDATPFRNINTPEDWAAYLDATHAT